MSEWVDYEYEVVLRVTHREQVNPDMPSCNIHTVAQRIAADAHAMLNMNYTVEATSARLLGEGRKGKSA